MIIAEIGQNHCGKMWLAQNLIALAKENGADLVKFQLYEHKKLYSNDIPNIELSFEQAKTLFVFGELEGIEVFFSVFDVERVKWCEEIGVKKYKIAYSQRSNEELFNAIKATGKSFFVSSNQYIIYNPKYLNYSVLYCIPNYPTQFKDLSLCSLVSFEGFSDHTIGLDAAKIALSRGAKIIEKHFAIDHHTGIDAEWSMTPNELKELKRFEGVVKQVL